LIALTLSGGTLTAYKRTTNRLKLSPRFKKDFRKYQNLRSAIIKSLKLLMVQADRTSINLEPLEGRPGYWSIRVNYHIRILLRALEDEDGPYFLATDIGNHETYRKK
jgi:Txe/YoeB family toxin of Txe-Axe toxin-antitoxin module